MNIRFERSADSRIKLLDYFYWGNQESMDLQFRVRGTTDAYDVTWHRDGKKPKYTCTCPDFVRRQDHCKHIYFCFCRVLKFPPDVLAGLSDPELLQGITTFVAKRQALLQKTRTTDTSRKPLEHDAECPICFEGMSMETSVCCVNSCHNYLHKSCMRTWIETFGHGHTCPFCRAPWDLTQFET